MLRRIAVALVVSIASYVALAAQPAQYFPPQGQWAKKAPAEVGMDAAKLNTAIEFAKVRETNLNTWPRDFANQEKIFGSLLGPIPKNRAATNGVVIRSGYVVAEFGDTSAADPTYSVAKSMLATVAGIAVRDGLIKDLDAPVGTQIKDGGYNSAQNAKVTWRHHLQQERVAGRDVGEERRLRRNRRVRRRRAEAASVAGSGRLLRVQRRPHQSLFAVAAATVQEAGPRRLPR
jgi:hypothetical protein